MATPDPEMLATLVATFLEKQANLSHEERREVLHIATGLASRESATIEGLSVQQIRTRRKLVYRKLRLSGGAELLSHLLALSLELLARRDGA